MNAMRSALILVIAWVLLPLSSCSTTLVPTPRLPKETRKQLPDDELLAALQQDWAELQQVKMDNDLRQKLIERYNANLLIFLRRLRYDILHDTGKKHKSFPSYLQVEHEGLRNPRSLNDVYDDIVPAADVKTYSLEEHYLLPGLGVPLVGVIPASKIRDGDHLPNLHARGTVSTLTALLEFPEDGSRIVLRLLPRHWHERVLVGRVSYPLAGDFSASMEIFWNLTNIKRGRFLGLLNPQKLRDTTGLTSIERYNPDKIPVILTHGLGSSAETFNNLVNRLLSDREVRNNYQFWYFNYATGISWAVSAANFREALRQARLQFDPHDKNNYWDKMVVVGHSMGGLITHLNQSEPTGNIPQDLPPELSPSDALMKELFEFQPIKVGQVVYMATPHRGAPIARNRLVLLLSNLVKLPKVLLTEALSIATLQENTILTNPRKFTRWFTSIAQLSPDSSDIRALALRPVQQVPTHSIIGDRGRHNSPRSSDGVVPYWSSHISWGTETIVPKNHHVHKAPETAEDMKRVLKEHLARTKGERKAHSH